MPASGMLTRAIEGLLAALLLVNRGWSDVLHRRELAP